MTRPRWKWIALLLTLLFGGLFLLTPKSSASGARGGLDEALQRVLDQHGFTGRIADLPSGRPVHVFR